MFVGGLVFVLFPVAASAHLAHDGSVELPTPPPPPTIPGSEDLVPVGSVEIPPMPNEVEGFIPAGSLGREDAPQPEPAPAPGPVDPNGRG